MKKIFQKIITIIKKIIVKIKSIFSSNAKKLSDELKDYIMSLIETMVNGFENLSNEVKKDE